MSQHVAEVKGWPNSNKTMMLQFVFPGKAWRAFSAFRSTESGDYAKVKATVLEVY